MQTRIARGFRLFSQVPSCHRNPEAPGTSKPAPKCLLHEPPFDLKLLSSTTFFCSIDLDRVRFHCQSFTDQPERTRRAKMQTIKDIGSSIAGKVLRDVCARCVYRVLM